MWKYTKKQRVFVQNLKMMKRLFIFAKKYVIIILYMCNLHILHVFLLLFFDGAVDFGEALIQNAPILDHTEIFKAEGARPSGKPLCGAEGLG